MVDTHGAAVSISGHNDSEGISIYLAMMQAPGNISVTVDGRVVEGLTLRTNEGLPVTPDGRLVFVLEK